MVSPHCLFLLLLVHLENSVSLCQHQWTSTAKTQPLVINIYKIEAFYFFAKLHKFLRQHYLKKKNFWIFFFSHSSLPSHNHSSLHAAPIYFSLLFSHGSKAEPSLWEKKIDIYIYIYMEWQCWDVARESWRCESHTNTKITMEYVWIFLLKKNNYAPQSLNVKSLKQLLIS